MRTRTPIQGGFLTSLNAGLLTHATCIRLRITLTLGEDLVYGGAHSHIVPELGGMEPRAHRQRGRFGDLLGQVVQVVPLGAKIIPVGVAQLVTTCNHFERPEFNPQPQQKNPASARFSLPAVSSVFLHVFQLFSSPEKVVTARSPWVATT